MLTFRTESFLAGTIIGIYVSDLLTLTIIHAYLAKYRFKWGGKKARVGVGFLVQQIPQRESIPNALAAERGGG